MNIVPALQQQKVMIISAVAVIIIIFFGSWLAARESNSSDGPGTNPTNTAEQEALTISIAEDSANSNTTEKTYTLTVHETKEQMISLGLRLNIDGGTVVRTDQSSSFSSNSQLGNVGWQAAVNTSIETTQNRSTMEVGFVNLKPESGPITAPLELGKFTIKVTAAGATPQFSIDQGVSTAITKSGTPMTINVLIKPTITE